MSRSIFKTPPFAHQLKAYEQSKDEEVFALFMEQGTGKSKVEIDATAYAYGKGRIEALFVVAPNGVHINWILNEIPAHLHDSIERRCVWWSSNRTLKKKREIESLYDPKFKGLRVFAMNVDAFVTARGKVAAKRFLKTFKCKWVLDESSRIKSHSAKRTGTIVDMGGLATMRRILTGTPVTQSPLDLFPQFQFLDPWILGIQNFTAFKAEYAELLPEGHGLLKHIKDRVMHQRHSTGSKRRVFTPQIIARDDEGRPKYKNLDKLADKIRPHMYRVRKADCLDLPDKLYQRVYCEVTDEQQQMYAALRDDLRLQLKSGELLTLTKLTLVMRLQQLLCGHGPDKTGMHFDVPIFSDPEDNPRIQALVNAVDETEGGVIIWSRFKRGIADIVSALGKCFPADAIVQYHGDVKQEARVDAVRVFQQGDARFFVGQQQSGGIGLTLTAARTVVYYANDFSLETRLQSEDRAHRIGQHHPVLYIDVEAVETIDGAIITALRNKKDVADMITGDPKCDWI